MQRRSEDIVKFARDYPTEGRGGCRCWVKFPGGGLDSPYSDFLSKEDQPGNSCSGERTIPWVNGRSDMVAMDDVIEDTEDEED